MWRVVDIPSDSQTRIIGNDEFTEYIIESFVIPSPSTHIGIDSFFNCTNIQIVEISENENENIDPSYIYSCNDSRGILLIFWWSYIICFSILDIFYS